MAYLKGPADADHFRVKVGRYKDRWYYDPLPTCKIADASDDVLPSVSIIKGAHGQDWTYTGLKRVAKALEESPHDLDGLDFNKRYSRLKTYNQDDLSLAQNRGSGVHVEAEALLLDRDPKAALKGDLMFNPKRKEGYKLALDYLDALKEWFDNYQPELIAKEIVCFHRGTDDVNEHSGWGGTADTFVKITGNVPIKGETVIIDWKSRGIDSDHGCYAGEAIQVAAYARAQYAIGEEGRILVPRCSRGLIVSVRPDGCRPYPIDLDKAYSHWLATVRWWTARQTEDDAIGKPLAPKGTTSSTPSTPTSNTSPTKSTTSPTTSPASANWDELTFDEPPPPSASSPDDTKRLPLTLGGTSTPTTPSPASTSPDEGVDVDRADIEGLKRRYNALTSEQRAWANSVTPFNVADKPTLRRYHIARAIIRFASLDADDEMIRTALHIVMGEEIQTSISTKDVLSALKIEEGGKLNAIAVALHQGHGFEFTADGPKVAAA